jgi:circadian clock protein KaiC
MEKQKIFKTQIKGFDALFSLGGIPTGSTILVAGGAGTGKSIFCRQICCNIALQNKKCMYVTFDETPQDIIESMEEFGWGAEKLQKKGNLFIQEINPMDILRIKFGSVSGSGSATEISHKIKPLIMPPGFQPEVIVIDSLTAVISASVSKDQNYRVFLHRFFNFFKETNATSFLITETEAIPTKYSPYGIAEFLADGIIVFYNLPKGNVRENTLEVLKMRHEQHQKQKVPMKITNTGIQLASSKE